jgi:hypothetical protein
MRSFRAVVEHARRLEFAGNAEFRKRLDSTARDVVASKPHPARIRTYDARQHVEKRAFARAVRTDDACRPRIGDAQADAIDGDDAAEVNGERICLE